MAKFLIEVPHPEDKLGCARSIQVFLQSGSHYLTHADYGCGDGEHCSPSRIYGCFPLHVIPRAEARRQAS